MHAYVCVRMCVSRRSPRMCSLKLQGPNMSRRYLVMKGWEAMSFQDAFAVELETPVGYPVNGPAIIKILEDRNTPLSTQS